MRVLVVEHDPLSTPAGVGAHLEKRGATLEHFVLVEAVDRPEVASPFPSDVDHDLVLLMGAPWSVYDPGVANWIGAELDLIRRRTETGRPVLGICFGAQAMSLALGGSVTPSGRPEHGWVPLRPLTEEISAGPWFQFHRDEFSLPPGGEALAVNESGLQAFTLGRNLAVQFHPEATGDLIASWCRAGADLALRDVGVDPDALVEQTYRLEGATQESTERMLDWYLDEISRLG